MLILQKIFDPTFFYKCLWLRLSPWLCVYTSHLLEKVKERNNFPYWKDVYVIPFIFMSFIPEWVRNEEMTQKWRLSAGMRLASSQSFLVIRLIRRSSKTQNDSRMRKNVIFKSFPRNNQTQLSFVGKMFQLWDNGYRWASEWHRMTRKW